jgi:hypothetical protein
MFDKHACKPSEDYFHHVYRRDEVHTNADDISGAALATLLQHEGNMGRWLTSIAVADAS